MFITSMNRIKAYIIKTKTMNNNTLLKAATTLCIAGGIGIASPLIGKIKKEKSKPNFIIFFVDDMGWRDVGFNGSKYYNTPNIDKMASEGVIFTNAYANAPNCAPSRACLMSGLYTPRHGIFTVGKPNRGKSRDRKLLPPKNKTTLDTKFVTLAEALKQNGYNTCHAGKWHLGEGAETGPTAQGFDVNLGGFHAGHPKSYFSPYKNPYLSDGPVGEHLTDRLTTDVLKFIDGNKENPFFVYFSLYAVHTPIQAKKEITQKYVNKMPDRGQDNPKYAAMIETTDVAMGRIIERLKALNIDDNTMIIFFSDNGGHGGTTSCRPLKGSKGSLYEGGIKEPMAIRWPGMIKAKSMCETPVIGTDFYPTLLELAGGDTENYKLDGKSLTPLLFKKGKFKREAIYWHFPAYLQSYKGYKYPQELVKGWRSVPSSAIRMGDWKLIEDLEDNTHELYNLKKDLGEHNNLANNKKKIARKLLKRLQNWRKATNAPMPLGINSEYKK